MTVGRCYLHELERRRALRDRVGYGGIVGAAIAAVVVVAMWLAVVG